MSEEVPLPYGVLRKRPSLVLGVVLRLRLRPRSLFRSKIDSPKSFPICEISPQFYQIDTPRPNPFPYVRLRSHHVQNKTRGREAVPEKKLGETGQDPAVHERDENDREKSSGFFDVRLFLPDGVKREGPVKGQSHSH